MPVVPINYRLNDGRTDFSYLWFSFLGRANDLDYYHNKHHTIKLLVLMIMLCFLFIINIKTTIKQHIIIMIIYNYYESSSHKNTEYDI